MSQVRKTCGDRASRKERTWEAGVKAMSSRMEQAWGRSDCAHLQGLGPGSRDSKLGAGRWQEGGQELPSVSVTIELA